VLSSLRSSLILFQGVPVSSYKPPSSANEPPSPPPPPPPPPPPADLSAPANGIGGTAAVFAELNRGEEVTKGLRKVDRSQMTHKNPELRAGGAVPVSTSPGMNPYFILATRLILYRLQVQSGQQNHPSHQHWRARNPPSLLWKEASGPLLVTLSRTLEARAHNCLL
jgi:hypothetical protein